MKQFFKVIGCGVLMIALSAITVLLIAGSIYLLIKDLPTATGLAAVAMFVFRVLQLAVGVGFLYWLGYIAIKSEEID